MASKSMITVVLDVGKTMGATLFQAKSKMDVMKSIVLNFFTQRYNDSKTTQFAVFTYGDSITSHDFSHEAGYENINMLISCRILDQSDWQRIHQITTCDNQVADTLSGVLLLAHDHLNTKNEKLKYNRSIVVITDGETNVRSNDDDDFCYDNFTQSVDAKDQQVIIVMLGKVTPSSSQIKKDNAEFFKSLAHRYTEADTVGEALWILSFGIGLSATPQQKRTFLEITPRLKIPCVSWGMVSKKTLPSLKTKWKDFKANHNIAEEESPKKAAKFETLLTEGGGAGGFGFPATGGFDSSRGTSGNGNGFDGTTTTIAASPTDVIDVNSSSSSSNISFVPAHTFAQPSVSASTADPAFSAGMLSRDTDIDDVNTNAVLKDTTRDVEHFVTDEAVNMENRKDGTTVTVTNDDIIDGYRYGKDYIAVPQETLNEAKIKEEVPCFRLIGFIPASSLPSHHYLTETSVMVGNDANQESMVAIAALSSALSEMQMVAIARRVVAKDGNPVQVALVPPAKSNGTLLVHRIPFADDLRPLPFDKEKEIDMQNPAYAAIGQLVRLQTMQVTEKNLTPVNTSLYRIMSTITQKILRCEDGDIIQDAGDVYSIPFPTNVSQDIIVQVSTIEENYGLEKKEEEDPKKKKKAVFQSAAPPEDWEAKVVEMTTQSNTSQEHNVSINEPAVASQNLTSEVSVKTEKI